MYNIIVGQSGGPTAVINASLYGVIDEALSLTVYKKINEKISKTTDPDKAFELLSENKRLTDLRNKIAAMLNRVFSN